MILGKLSIRVLPAPGQRRSCLTDGLSVSVSGPDQLCLVLLAEWLVATTVLKGARAVVVDSAKPPRVLLQRVERRPRCLAAVDATGIAQDEGTDPVVPLLGAAAIALPELDTDALCSAIWGHYDSHFGYAARSALRAFDLGLRQATLVTTD